MPWRRAAVLGGDMVAAPLAAQALGASPVAWPAVLDTAFGSAARRSGATALFLSWPAPGGRAATLVYGFADLEAGRAATVATRVRIASLTKSVTAALVVRASLAGKFSLDSPVARLLPDLPDTWRHVTVRHVLGHQGGLPGYTAASRTTARRRAPVDRVREAIARERSRGEDPVFVPLEVPAERPAPAAGQALIGVWRGRVNVAGGTPYDLVLTIEASGDTLAARSEVMFPDGRPRTGPVALIRLIEGGLERGQPLRGMSGTP